MHGEGQFTDAAGVLWRGVFYNGTGPGLQRGPDGDLIATV